MISSKPGRTIQSIWQRGRLVWLCLLAALWRLLFLGRADLWGDEILYLNRSSPPDGPWDVVRAHLEMFPALPYLPLPSMIQNAFLWVFQPFVEDVTRSAFAQRFPAALFGTLTVVCAYLLFRKLSSRRIAQLAALMLSVFYFPLYYSREARFYAPLLLFVTALNLLYYHTLKKRKLTWTMGAGLLLLAMATSHVALSGVLFVGALLGISGLSLLLAWRPSGVETKPWRILHGKIAALLAVAIASFLPMLFAYMKEGTSLGRTEMAAWTVLLRDLFGRMLMGASNIGWLVSAILLLAGLYFVLANRRGRYYQATYLLGSGVVFLLTLYNVITSEYYFARTFYGMTTAVLWLAAVGLEGLCFRTPATRRAERWRTAAFRTAAALLLGIHVFLYAPMLLSLTAKGNDFGAVARYLNEHLEPGTPYVMASAYNVSFVAEHFQTPDLVPVIPYVHGGGAAEIATLRARQKDFFRRFPEAYLVKSGWHQPPWSWPGEHFSHRHKLENRPLRLLTQWGIEGEHYLHSPSIYHSYIYHNTPEDIQRQLKTRGESLYLEFPDWQCVSYARFEYGRLAPAYRAVIRILNLEQENIRGAFLLHAAVMGPPTLHDVVFRYGQQAPAQTKQAGGRAWQVRTPDYQIPSGWSELIIEIPAGEAQSGIRLLLLDAGFAKDPPS